VWLRLAMAVATSVGCVLVGTPAALAAAKGGWRSETTTASLWAVSCSMPKACVAVGSAGLGEGVPTEVWNGDEWQTATAPSPSGYELSGVDCVSSDDCLAVGGAAVGGNAVVEGWNGRSWAVQPSPKLRTPLDSVSCSSAVNCLAVVGDVVELLAGKRWSVVPLPAAVRAHSGFDAVSCRSARFCLIGGGSLNGGPAAVIWNGTTWRATPAVQVPTTHEPISGAFFSAVACTSSSWCMAVGFGDYLPPHASSGDQAPVADVWNGSTWSNVSPPMPPRSDATQLTSLWCESRIRCYAAGFAGRGDTSQALIERWAGRRWTRFPSAGSDQARTDLHGISCIAHTRWCAAVGVASTGGAGGGFVETTSNLP